jgi:hypothetical protein
MTKPVAIWNLAAVAIVVGLWDWRSNGNRMQRLQPTLGLVGGGLAAVTVVLAPLAAAGALDDFFDANVRFNLLYSGQLSLAERLGRMASGVVQFIGAAAPLVATAALGLGVVLRRRAWPHDHLLALWAAASLLGVASAGRFFPHYFVHLLPAIALLSAVVLSDIRTRFRPQRMHMPALAMLGGLTAFVTAAPVWSNLAVYLRPTVEERHVAKFPDIQAEEENLGPRLGAYLAERTLPGDSIYNFGRDSQLYFYADRRPAARHFYDRQFWLDPSTLTETIEVLRAERPAYIVDTVMRTSPLPELGVTARVGPNYYPPEFAALLVDYYEFVGRVLYADIYRLRPQ